MTASTWTILAFPVTNGNRWPERALEPARTMTATAAPNLARIPAGEFTMGASDADEDERPVHRVFVSEFFIGRFPVTNDEYARFVRAAGYPAPTIRGLPLIAAGGRDSIFKELGAPYVWERNEPPAGHGSHPVVLVRYDDALAYCRWLSDVLGRVVRLPTEAEWEKAARGGVEGLRYPWGNDIDPSRCNFPGGSVGQAPARHAAHGHVSAQPVRPLRRRRQRVGMGVGLVQRRLLQRRRRARSARPRVGQHADRPRRLVGQRGRVDAQVRVPAQGAARHVRLQRRIQNRMRGLIVLLAALVAPVAPVAPIALVAPLARSRPLGPNPRRR